MTTLHDRLADLAEDAPPARPVPGLWDRGLSYRRRRRAGTAVVLVLAAVALVALASVTWLRSPSAVEPLPAGSPAGVPDRLFAPSPWLPDTDGHPLGQIAAVIRADRGTWSGANDPQVVGVSATTGEYRFLDLPHLNADLGDAWALSPDGRHVAYLYAEEDLAGSPYATGLALYDAETGETRFARLPSTHGIQAAPARSLLWAGDDTVVLAYSATTDPDESATQQQPLLAWNVHVDQPTVLSDGDPVINLRSAGPGFAVVSTSKEFAVVDTTTGASVRDLPKLSGRSWTFDGSASRFAFLVGRPASRSVRVGTLGGGSTATPTYVDVPGTEASSDLVAWVDDDHVVVEQVTGDVARMRSVDVRSGVALATVSWSRVQIDGAQLSTDLLAKRTVRGIRPPHPLDPRKVLAGALVLLLMAGWAVITWRRRVRP